MALFPPPLPVPSRRTAAAGLRPAKSYTPEERPFIYPPPPPYPSMVPIDDAEPVPSPRARVRAELTRLKPGPLFTEDAESAMLGCCWSGDPLCMDDIVDRLRLHDRDDGPDDLTEASTTIMWLRRRLAEVKLALEVNQHKGYVLERILWEGSEPVYAHISEGKVKWTNDLDAALRFARRDDAGLFLTTIGETVRLTGLTHVKEHTWS